MEAGWALLPADPLPPTWRAAIPKLAAGALGAWYARRSLISSVPLAAILKWMAQLHARPASCGTECPRAS